MHYYFAVYNARQVLCIMINCLSERFAVVFQSLYTLHTFESFLLFHFTTCCLEWDHKLNELGCDIQLKENWPTPC